MRTWLLVALLLSSGSASAADEYKIIKLEQDMRNLEREVRTLARQVDELRSNLQRSDEIVPPSTARGATVTSTTWLSAANWDRIHEGMSELAVIEGLGPPTSMRSEGERRVLLYALEIGVAQFLSGSVTLTARVVTAVEKPVLK